MYSPCNITFQPYYFIQLPNNLYSPFMFQDSLPLVFQQFPHHNNFQIQLNQPNIPQKPTETLTQAVSSSKSRASAAKASFQEENLHNANIIKEKIIKKLANRPATYLTEKKFYLAQTLIEDSNSNRKLRPRNLKKKHHRTHQKPAINGQVCLQGKNQDLLVKNGKGIDSFQEQCQERKLAQKQPLNMEKTMNSFDSPASQQKK